MKILIATGIYPPDIGGPAQYARSLYELWKKDHEVKVAAYRWERAFPPLVRHLLYFLKIIRKGYNADLILVLDTWSCAVPTMFACSLMRKKYIMRTGGDFLWETYVERTGDLVLFKDFYNTSLKKLSIKERLVFALSGKALRNAKAVIFSTVWQKNIFEKVYKLKRTFIVENYCGEKLPRVEINNRNFVAGTRSLKWKNLEILENAFRRAKYTLAEEKRPGITLDTGKAVYDSFLEKIHGSYAVILASLGDISPNMIFDAIRAETPFILTEENGIKDRIKDCALFVDPKDEFDIAKKVVWLSDPKNWALQKEKLKKFNFTHSWSQIGKEILDIAKKDEK